MNHIDYTYSQTYAWYMEVDMLTSKLYMPQLVRGPEYLARLRVLGCLARSRKQEITETDLAVFHEPMLPPSGMQPTGQLKHYFQFTHTLRKSMLCSEM